jgi:dTDP-4-amino-4,6-dideoxygalactose transaminase
MSTATKMEFIDLAAQQSRIRGRIDAAIARVLDAGQYIMGPEVSTFERQLREFAGVRHAITCANGTDALTLVLMAWDIGPGDAVFVPSFTFVATAEAPAQLGATPIFVDVESETFNISLSSLETAIADAVQRGLRPAAVIPVDLFGHPADIPAVETVARPHGIKVLVDAAQSFGGRIGDSRVGLLGDATTTSFFPAKPLGCYGDGGAVFTQDDDLAARIESIRVHGKGTEKYDNVRVGVNSRLDTIQAAILIEKLAIFEDELDKRQQVADRYLFSISQAFDLPHTRRGYRSAWAQFTLRSPQRDQVIAALKARGIPTAIYYPKPLSEQSGYTSFPTVSSGCRVSEQLSREVFSIPMHPYMTDDEISRVVDALNETVDMLDRQDR